MALTKAQLVDMNSNELILDLDADTSLHSSTDDQIDIKIGGADDFRFTANTFTALAGSGIVIPDGGLTLGSTAVSSTAAELNILDGVTSTATELNIIDGNATVGTTAFADGDGIVTNDNGTMRQTSATTLKTYIADVTLTTAAQTNITSLGTLSALTVDDVAIDGKVVTMTGSTDDTFVTTVAANGATSLVTTDTAAAAANLTITADGTVGINSTGDMTLDSSADIVLDAAGGDLNFKQAGTEILRISNTSTNAVLQNRVDSADIIFKQADGTETLRLDDDTTVKVATDLTIGDDASLISDAAVLNFGANSEIKLTHVHDTGLLLTDSGGSPTLQLHDANESVSSDGSKLILTSNGVAFSLPTADGSSGEALTTNGSGVLSFSAVSANTPSSADGQALGSASLEWSDLFLADGGTIQFGNDQEVRLIHTADTGLILKHTATADDKPVSLTLQTGETDMAANDVIGKIDFQAPDEGTGTDAILVAAGIEAVAEGDFSSSNNATKLSFKTAASEAASEKMSLSSAGLLTVADDIVFKDGGTIGVTSATDAMTVSSGGIVTFKDDILIKDGGTIGSASDADAMSIASGGAVTFTQTPVFPDGSLALADLDIDGGTDIGADIVDADLFIIDDGAGGTNRKVTASRIKTYAGGLTGVSTGSGNVTITDGNLVVADGHGIDFAATADLSDGDATPTQELFDDYEEGTWTATVGNAGGGTITVNSSSDECTYVKIGRHVFLNGSIGISSVSSPSGRLTIDGKPFNTTGGEGGHRGAGSMMLHNPASDEGSGLVPMVFEDYAPIRIHNSSSGGEVNANKIQASTELRFAVNYHKG